MEEKKKDMLKHIQELEEKMAQLDQMAKQQQTNDLNQIIQMMKGIKKDDEE